MPSEAVLAEPPCGIACFHKHLLHARDTYLLALQCMPLAADMLLLMAHPFSPARRTSELSVPPGHRPAKLPRHVSRPMRMRAAPAPGRTATPFLIRDTVLLCLTNKCACRHTGAAAGRPRVPRKRAHFSAKQRAALDALGERRKWVLTGMPQNEREEFCRDEGVTWVRSLPHLCSLATCCKCIATVEVTQVVPAEHEDTEIWMIMVGLHAVQPFNVH